MEENNIMEEKPSGRGSNKLDPKKLLLVIGPALILVAAISMILIFGRNNDSGICTNDEKMFANPNKFPAVNDTNVIETFDYHLEEKHIYNDETKFKNFDGSEFINSKGEPITHVGELRDAYAAKHALNKADSSFKKVKYNQLFDGVMSCVYSPNSNVYLLETGVMIDMNRKIQSYENIVFDYSYSIGKFAMDITVSYYKKVSQKPARYQEFAFHFSPVISTSGGGSPYTMQSFYPEDIMDDGNTLVDCSVMALRFTADAVTLEYDQLKTIEDFSLINFIKLYEWQMPNSVWKK